MEEVTDLDKEVAWQLVQLSEGDTTTATATTTTSSSGSCNNKSSAIFTTLGKVVDDNISGCYKFKGNINNNKRMKVEKDGDKDNIAQVFIKKVKKNSNVKASLSLDSIVAGVLEDDDEHNEFDNSQKKKIMKYRSIIELYSVTKPVDDYCFADEQ